MKRTIQLLLLTLSALLLPSPAGAQAPADSAPADSALAGFAGQTPGSVQPGAPSLVRSKIHLLARAYGDSIVLRWAPEDYVSWKYLNQTGYNLLRVSDGGFDTLAYALKPLSKEQMLAKYTNPADSLAAIVAQVTWGDNSQRIIQTRNQPGTMGALVEMSEDQNMMFGMAVLVSEWRRDLASDLAMRFVDRNVRQGQHYQYILQPTVWDPDSILIFQPGFIQDIENTRYTPEAFNVVISDSIVSPFQVNLEWPMHNYSSFEIERRLATASGGFAAGSSVPAGLPTDLPAGAASGDWQRVNSLPFVPFLKEDVAQTTALFADFVHEPGTYDYRVRAHDLFGDLTEPSPYITVVMGDRTPPSMPTVTRIDIDRTDSQRILAHIFWEKDTIEADLKGFMPLYYNRRLSDQWLPLRTVGNMSNGLRPLGQDSILASNDIISPADTTCTVDVTGLSTGMLVVAAYDESGNIRHSMPVQIRIEDMVPPPAPQNLRADVETNGRVTLTWSAPSDDVDYYQVAFANDTTHAWQFRSQAQLRDTVFVDSLALDVNQRYIYYKVHAIDYSTNEGDYSEVLRVERPTLMPPSVAHLDSAWVDPQGINMRWVAGRDEQMDHHLLWRRMDNEREWTLLARFDADSVKAAGDIISYCDTPPYNRNRRYLYAVESLNSSDISSGLSLAYSVKRRPPLNVHCTITLTGAYVKDTEGSECRLAWEVSGLDAADDQDYYFSVYRQAPGDDLFRFVTTTRKDEQQYEDIRLHPGEQASYYVKLLTRDGRESSASNVVTITANEQ